MANAYMEEAESNQDLKQAPCMGMT
ncbi:uncharacterized protein G2W53_016345 [Senna tora]|uniref:Uncharacterized protein n=1 Tax=Senna tora TaxID=362788 RepID=A0A834TQM4_9FABA|nr:uncharacterized protein G2W53_016345 [Senna tora]